MNLDPSRILSLHHICILSKKNKNIFCLIFSLTYQDNSVGTTVMYIIFISAPIIAFAAGMHYMLKCGTATNAVVRGRILRFKFLALVAMPHTTPSQVSSPVHDARLFKDLQLNSNNVCT